MTGLYVQVGPTRTGWAILAIAYEPPMRPARKAPPSIRRMLEPHQSSFLAQLLGSEEGE